MPCSPPEMFPFNTDLSSIGVYNVLAQDYGDGMTICGMKTSYGPSENADALQSAIDVASANGGGTILIPTGTYQIQGPIYIGHHTQTGSPPHFGSLLIRGTSGSTILQVTVAGDLFHIDTDYAGDTDVTGTTIEDLTIQYDAVDTGTAIVLGDHGFGSPPKVGAQNVRLFRVVFLDCPCAAYFADTLQCSMLECTIQYINNQPATRALLFGKSGAHFAKETYIADCSITNAFQSIQGGGAKAVEIAICDQFRMTNSYIEGFQQGIAIDPSESSALKIFLADVKVFTTSAESGTGAALLIYPTGTGQVLQVEAIGCDFEPDTTYPDSPTLYTGAGIVIQGSGTSTPVVDQVRIVSCYSCTWPGQGLTIAGANNVEVLGGYYSCNGTDTSLSAHDRCGISAGNNNAGIRITGVACNNSVYSESLTQEYGISITTTAGAPPNVFIRSCDLYGNLTGPLYVGVITTGLEVTNTRGYNDQASTLYHILPASGATIRNYTYFYYGPITFYISSLTSLSVDGTSTGITSGGIGVTLGPGEYAEFTYSGTPTFLVVGK